MRNRLLLCGLVGFTAIAVFAMASDPPAGSSSVELPKAKVESDAALSETIPEKLRVFTKVALDTKEGQQVWRAFQTVRADSHCQQRLDFICDHFAMDNVSATAWTYTITAVRKVDDDVAFEIEVVPTMVKGRQPAAVVNGVLVEKWVLNAGKKRCQCTSRKFDGKPVFVTD